MNRIATLLVFKPDVSPEEAAAAVKGLEAILDPNYFVAGATAGGLPVRAVDGKRRLATIESYNSEWGGPVFYIP